MLKLGITLFSAYFDETIRETMLFYFVAIFTKKKQKIAEDVLCHTPSFISITFCFQRPCTEICNEKKKKVLTFRIKMPFMKGW